VSIVMHSIWESNGIRLMLIVVRLPYDCP